MALWKFEPVISKPIMIGPVINLVLAGICVLGVHNLLVRPKRGEGVEDGMSGEGSVV